MSDFQHIDRFAHDLMMGVVTSGVVNDRNMTRALEIMRAEAKEFLAGETYADERAVVLAGSVHPGYAMASVVASCVLKIQGAA